MNVTCNNCKWKVKNPAGFGFMCTLNPPVPVPVPNGHGQMAVTPIWPPLTDNSPACQYHSAALSALA